VVCVGGVFIGVAYESLEPGESILNLIEVGDCKAAADGGSLCRSSDALWSDKVYASGGGHLAE
jgi:hypothetical protein